MNSESTQMIRAWLWLMAFTVLMGIAADVGTGGRLAWWALVAVGILALAKSRIVLADFLGLRVAPGALKGFAAGFGVTIVIVTASFLLVPNK